MNELEKELIAELMSVRFMADASFLSGTKATDYVYKSLESYSELTLPYAFKSAKIKELSDKETAEWNAFIKQKQKELDEANEKKKKK